MVHPLAVKKANGKIKTKLCSDGEIRDVFRAAHHIVQTAKGTSYETHPEAIDFVWMN